MPSSIANSVTKLFEPYQGTWMVAGGWAIDLYLNEQTRTHGDIEIAIPRREQYLLYEFLEKWELNYVESGAFKAWKAGHWIELPIHEIHATLDGFHLEILFNEITSERWYFRRDPAISLPLDKTIIKNEGGIPILCPEAVLLYKAKHNEEKDLHDLKHTLQKLAKDSMGWLHKSIAYIHGKEHPWLAIIEEEKSYL